MVDTLALLFPHVETTGDVTVRVAASYLVEQSAPAAGRWFWSYHVRIENDGDLSVRLLSRHWIIRDAQGSVHEVTGDGVVGEMPLIPPGGSFDYVSGCPLTTASGSMRGSYALVSEDGERLAVAIPEFPLLSVTT
jgi:ApaG protein